MSRVFAIATALATNAVALAAVHGGMGQILERERLALGEPARIVVVAKRFDPQLVTVHTCPAPSSGML